MSEAEKALDSIGAVAEMALVYFKATMGAGATLEEAMILTKIFLAAEFEEADRQKKEQDCAEMEE